MIFLRLYDNSFRSIIYLLFVTYMRKGRYLYIRILFLTRLTVI